ncbi:hypothetical protein ACLB2K_038083 [Fragaria x ananassa]
MKSTNCNSSAPARMKEKQQRLSPGKEKTQKIRQRLFKNRWSTLKRKAKHLASLCNGQVCMVMSGSNGELEVWPNPGNPAVAEAIMTKYLEAHNERSITRKKLELNLSDFPEYRKTDAVDTGKGFKSHDKGFAECDEEFDKLSRDSWMNLSVFLKSKVQKLDETLRSVEVSNPVYMSGYSERVGSFGQSNNNIIYNSFPPWRISDCYNNPYEGIYGSTTPNSGQTVISYAESIGFGEVENTMHQQRRQNMNGYGERDLLSQLDQHQQFMGVPQSHQSHFDEVPNFQFHYGHVQNMMFD